MARILTLGMAVLDHVFRVEDFPQAGRKYRAEDYSVHIGGPAALAAVTVARLGGGASLCTRLGDDANSRVVTAELEDAGVDLAPSIIVPGGMAPISSVYVDDRGERQIVNFRGRGLDVTDDALDGVRLDGVDAVLVDPRWPEAAKRILMMTAERGIPTVVDGESDLSELEDVLGNATHLAFSAQGLASLSGQESPIDGLRHCAERYGCWVGVTLGEKGVIYLDEGSVAHVAAFPVKASDTLGAGDVWHGAFVLGLGEGHSIFHAVRFANAAAALKCVNGSGWSSLPSREETMALLTGTGPSQ